MPEAPKCDPDKTFDDWFLSYYKPSRLTFVSNHNEIADQRNELAFAWNAALERAASTFACSWCDVWPTKAPRRGLVHDQDGMNKYLCPRAFIRQFKKEPPFSPWSMIWKCTSCGVLSYPSNDGSWRCNDQGLEHKCPGIHAQAGHMPAVQTRQTVGEIEYPKASD